MLPEVHEERAVARRFFGGELRGPFLGRLRVRLSMAEARPVATQVHAPGLRAGQRRDGGERAHQVADDARPERALGRLLLELRDARVEDRLP